MIKLKKEGFQHYSFEFKGVPYSVEYISFEDAYNNFKVTKGWQILESNNYPINEKVTTTRKDALNTFIFNNQLNKEI